MLACKTVRAENGAENEFLGYTEDIEGEVIKGSKQWLTMKSQIKDVRMWCFRS